MLAHGLLTRSGLLASEGDQLIYVLGSGIVAGYGSSDDQIGVQHTNSDMRLRTLGHDPSHTLLAHGRYGNRLVSGNTLTLLNRFLKR